MSNWERFKKYYLQSKGLEFALDISRIHFEDDYLEQMEPKMQAAYQSMEALESGAIANPDENRMVGHYWLRNAALAPDPAICLDIETCLSKIREMTTDVHSGTVAGSDGSFDHCLIIGIGGSALGPQFVADALGCPKRDKLQLHFFDNTDPDGIDRTLTTLDGQLGRTLCIVISKSGGTPETRNGMLEAKAAYQAVGLDFASGYHCISMHSKDRTFLAFALHVSELPEEAVEWLHANFANSFLPSRQCFVFEYLALPFGLSSSCKTFNDLVTALAGFWRRCPLDNLATRVSSYIDDVTGVAASFSQ